MWNFKGDLWNSTQSTLPIHWKVQFLYNVEMQEILDLKARKRFWNAPLDTNLFCPLVGSVAVAIPIQDADVYKLTLKRPIHMVMVSIVYCQNRLIMGSRQFTSFQTVHVTNGHSGK